MNEKGTMIAEIGDCATVFDIHENGHEMDNYQKSKYRGLSEIFLYTEIFLFFLK